MDEKDSKKPSLLEAKRDRVLDQHKERIERVRQIYTPEKALEMIRALGIPAHARREIAALHPVSGPVAERLEAAVQDHPIEAYAILVTCNENPPRNLKEQGASPRDSDAEAPTEPTEGDPMDTTSSKPRLALVSSELVAKSDRLDAQYHTVMSVHRESIEKVRAFYTPHGAREALRDLQIPPEAMEDVAVLVRGNGPVPARVSEAMAKYPVEALGIVTGYLRETRRHLAIELDRAARRLKRLEELEDLLSGRDQLI